MPIERDSKRETVRDIVNDIRAASDVGPPVDELDPEASLTDDLGVDSLDLAELTVRIEDAYGVDVFADGVVDEVGELLAALDEP